MKDMGREKAVVAGTPNTKVLTEVRPPSPQMFTSRLVPLELSWGRAQMTKDATHVCGGSQSYTFCSCFFM